MRFVNSDLEVELDVSFDLYLRFNNNNYELVAEKHKLTKQHELYIFKKFGLNADEGLRYKRSLLKDIRKENEIKIK